MIGIHGVCKGYDGYEVLHDISLEVKKGSIHGLIGENGSGKTTLIKCVTGIYQPDKGEVLIGAETVYENPSVKERIGYVADQNTYFPGYKLSGMMRFFEKMYPGFSEEKFRNYNTIFCLDMNQRVFQLSKGQKMRLALMLNLAVRPEVLVLDEPVSGLDAAAKREVLELLVQEVEENETTVFITSHQLTDLERICDAVTMIRYGKIQISDELDNLKERIRKFQAVFQKGIPLTLQNSKTVLDITNVGSIYTIVLKDGGASQAALLNEAGAVWLEEVPLSLEDIFVYASREALLWKK